MSDPKWPWQFGEKVRSWQCRIQEAVSFLLLMVDREEGREPFILSTSSIFAIVEHLLYAEVHSDDQKQMHCVEELWGVPVFLTYQRFCACLSPLFRLQGTWTSRGAKEVGGMWLVLLAGEGPEGELGVQHYVIVLAALSSLSLSLKSHSSRALPKWSHAQPASRLCIWQ